MARLRKLATTALLGATLLPATRVAAQVTVDLHALDSQNGSSKPSAPGPTEQAPARSHPAHKAPSSAHKHPEKPAQSMRAPVPPTPPRAAAPASPTAPARPASPPQSTQAPPAAVLPVAPPPPVRLSPLDAGTPPPAPPQATPPSTPPAVAADAGGGPAPLPGGVRVTFDPGRAELSPASETALRSLAEKAAKDDSVTFNVLAYAAGAPEDPSTPRRLSLSRALAVRSVLMASDVPSTHIYVRALGSSTGDAPADRADITVTGPDGAPVTGGVTQ